MIDLWNELARLEGMKGIYSIAVNANSSYYNLDASLQYEPRNAINCLNEKGWNI